MNTPSTTSTSLPTRQTHYRPVFLAGVATGVVGALAAGAVLTFVTGLLVKLLVPVLLIVAVIVVYRILK